MGQTEPIRMKLNPCTPPGQSNRKARAFAAEIARLRLVGYGCQAIREALADAGVRVSKSTVQRELARLSRPAPIAAWQTPVLPRLALSAQVDATLARLNASVQHLVQRIDRPWELWVTHAATAVASAVLTWFVVSWPVFK